MRASSFSALLVLISVHLCSAADFDIQTLNQGDFDFEIGDAECYKSLSFDEMNYSLDAEDIIVDGNACEGLKNALVLTPDEKVLGNELSKYLRAVDDIGTNLEGEARSEINCKGKKFTDQGTYFQVSLCQPLTERQLFQFGYPFID